MNGYKIALLAIQLVGLLATVASVGKPRKPLSGGVAAATVVTSLIVAGLIVLA